MIVDSSAVIAILRGEAERSTFVRALSENAPSQMSAANYLETCIVIDSLGDPVLTRRLDELLAELGVEVVPVTAAQVGIARAAYRDYGKGSGHPAGLNFGDVFSYALAVETRSALLFKGDDFGHTDVHPAN